MPTPSISAPVTPMVSSSKPPQAFSADSSPESDIDPRIIRTREAVLAAAVELLATEGIGRLTIDAIAQRSGVARSTVYRNWPERADLLLAAFESVAEIDCPLAALGCHGHHIVGDDCPARPALTVEDLRVVVEEHGQRFIHMGNSVLGAALGSIVAESSHDPAIAQALHRFGQARRQPLIEVARGVVSTIGSKPHTSFDAAVERFVSPFFYRFLVSGEPIDDTLVKRQTTLLLADLDLD